MKGRVKIELRDKQGNIVHTQEKENLVTNFIKDLFTPIAFSRSYLAIGASSSHRSSGYYDSNRDVTNTMFDCIQLLGDELNDDPADYMFGNQKVVGISRYQLGYTGSNPVYGSFNGSESGWNEDFTEYTYVYDWVTSGANDVEIKSVALSPIWACMAGCGLSSYDSSVYSLSSFGSPGYLYGTGYDANNQNIAKYYYSKNADFITPLVFDYENNYYLGVDYESFLNIHKNGTLSVSKLRIPLSKFFIGYAKRTAGGLMHHDVIGRNDITIKNQLGTTYNNTYGFTNYSDGKIYTMYTKETSIATGSSLIITVYDVETNTESYITFTNTTGKSLVLLSIGNNQYGYKHLPFVANNTLYAISTDGQNLWAINLENGTHTQVSYEDGTPYTYRNTYPSLILETGDRAIIGYQSAYNNAIGEGFALNTTNNTVRRISTHAGEYWLGSSGGNTLIAPFKKQPYMFGGLYYTNTNGEIIAFAQPLLASVFSTKFNLEEPFTKNNEQTLKVVYTLKFTD